MKIDRTWLESHNACEAGKEFFLSEGKLTPILGIRNLLAKEKLDWANWLIVRVLPHKKQVRYTIFAAELVLEFFESRYPDDKRPRQAIEAAKKYIKSPTEKNKNAVNAAAYAAANAIYTAVNAANAAANATYTAANAATYPTANAAANAAYAAANAAANAANAGAYAATYAVTLKKIVLFGLKLLRSSL